MAAVEKILTPDDIIKNQKDQQTKIHQMIKSEAFNKKIDLDDEVCIEINELWSELTKYQTLVQHKSQKREGISPEKLKENDV